MPSTITSYTTFQSGTKARSTQVNTNFSNYRGDYLPINTDTITASDLIHDLGSTDHRFDNVYAKSYVMGDVTTSGMFIRGETTGTRMNMFVGNTIAASVDETGITLQSLKGYYTVASIPNSFTTLGGTYTLAAMTISTTGNMIEVGLMSKPTTGTNRGTIRLENEAAGIADVGIDIYIDGARAAGAIFHGGTPTITSSHYVMPSSFRQFISVAAATHSVSVHFVLTSNNGNFGVDYTQLYVRELEF